MLMREAWGMQRHWEEEPDPSVSPIQGKWYPAPTVGVTAVITRTLTSVSYLLLWYGDLDPAQMLCHQDQPLVF